MTQELAVTPCLRLAWVGLEAEEIKGWGGEGKWGWISSDTEERVETNSAGPWELHPWRHYAVSLHY